MMTATLPVAWSSEDERLLETSICWSCGNGFEPARAWASRAFRSREAARSGRTRRRARRRIPASPTGSSSMAAPRGSGRGRATAAVRRRRGHRARCWRRTRELLAGEGQRRGRRRAPPKSTASERRSRLIATLPSSRRRLSLSWCRLFCAASCSADIEAPPRVAGGSPGSCAAPASRTAERGARRLRAPPADGDGDAEGEHEDVQLRRRAREQRRARRW